MKTSTGGFALYRTHLLKTVFNQSVGNVVQSTFLGYYFTLGSEFPDGVVFLKF